uniref:Uncharacterized protein n=1 Tax=Pavo cristatus TaxID=9049 RepID=A0A8C9EGB0_PAVCR
MGSCSLPPADTITVSFTCYISLVVRPGKDVRGLYPGQVGRVHQTYVPRGNDSCFLPRPFSRLQPAPANYEAQTPFQPDFDNSALRNYIHFQKRVRNPTADWYNQTSYKAAFDLPYFKTVSSTGPPKPFSSHYQCSGIPVPFITDRRQPMDENKPTYSYLCRLLSKNVS